VARQAGRTARERAMQHEYLSERARKLLMARSLKRRGDVAMVSLRESSLRTMASAPISSAHSNGPFGWVAPSFIARSMSTRRHAFGEGQEGLVP